MDTDYFVEQLGKKWPGVRIHFFTDPNEHSLLQFETGDELSVLGDFFGTGVWYRAFSNEDTAQFALWYRSIAPAEWSLHFYDSGLYHDVMHITNETTEAEIIAGFDIPFDVSKYE
jgi:hypothetical protein